MMNMLLGVLVEARFNVQHVEIRAFGGLQRIPDCFYMHAGRVIIHKQMKRSQLGPGHQDSFNH